MDDSSSQGSGVGTALRGAGSGPQTDVRCLQCGELHADSVAVCPRTGLSQHEPDPFVGQVLGDRYKIVARLGIGGMGAVYAAEHSRIGRRVAVKRVHTTLAHSADVVARFEREARAAAATGHENIVDVHDLGVDATGAPYLVMELLEGETLGAAIGREGQLAPMRACKIVGQVLAALDAVHRVGIVHRDLKPDNVFLLKRGRRDLVKVLDFGVSKIQGDATSMHLTRTGIVLGTPFYMSPEQARGARELDHRVDLYAAGAILYEALSGRLPYAADNYHALLHAIVSTRPTSLAELVPGLPDPLIALVERSLASLPEDRFQTAAEMLEALVPFGAEPLTPRSSEAPLPNVPRDAPALLAETQYGVDEDRAREKARSVSPSGSITAKREPARAPSRPGRTSQFPARAPTELDARSEMRRSSPPPMKRRRSLADYAPAPPRLSQTDPGEERTIDYGERTSFRAPETTRATPPRGGRMEGGRASVVQPSSPQPRPRTRASFVLEALGWVEARHGANAKSALLAGPSELHRAELGTDALPSAWVTLEAAEALLHAIDTTLGRRDGSVCREIGVATASRDLARANRVFVEGAAALGPSALARRVPALFRAYHDGAHVRVQLGEREWDIEAVGVPMGAHAQAMAGLYARWLELCGAKTVIATVRAATNGHVTRLRFAM